MKLWSPVFTENGKISPEYTCDGKDISPPLKVENIPEKTRSLALIVDDPDAPGGTWVHWVVWNIPPSTAEMPSGSVPKGAMQGLNSFKTTKYGGPCPPSGSHRYYFKMYALDTDLSLPGRTTKADLERAMSGHVLAEAQTMGRYR